MSSATWSPGLTPEKARVSAGCRSPSRWVSACGRAESPTARRGYVGVDSADAEPCPAYTPPAAAIAVTSAATLVRVVARDMGPALPAVRGTVSGHAAPHYRTLARAPAHRLVGMARGKRANGRAAL